MTTTMEALTAAVAAALTAQGMPAEHDYTGGGFWCVVVQEPRRVPPAGWMFGNQGDDWAGCLVEGDRSYAADDRYVYTTVSAESQDADAIAAGIAAAVRAETFGTADPCPVASPDGYDCDGDVGHPGPHWVDLGPTADGSDGGRREWPR